MKTQELLLDILEKLNEIRGRIIDIETAHEKSIEETKQFSSITNRGNFFKYPDNRTYEDIIARYSSERPHR